MALLHELNSNSEPRAAGHLIPEAASRWMLLQVCWGRELSLVESARALLILPLEFYSQSGD